MRLNRIQRSPFTPFSPSHRRVRPRRRLLFRSASLTLMRLGGRLLQMAATGAWGGIRWRARHCVPFGRSSLCTGRGDISLCAFVLKAYGDNRHLSKCANLPLAMSAVKLTLAAVNHLRRTCALRCLLLSGCLLLSFFLFLSFCFVRFHHRSRGESKVNSLDVLFYPVEFHDDGPRLISKLGLMFPRRGECGGIVNLL